jgi:hypothetical protein
VDIALSGDRLLEVQAPSNQQKGWKTIFFDLKTGHSDLLSKVLHQSEPINCEHQIAISGQWIACNISETETAIYNLTTHQHFSEAESLPSDSVHPLLF